ncbi:Fc.00g048040.m01.CDS01 [Cosmosporella sp. VM-42]
MAEEGGNVDATVAASEDHEEQPPKEPHKRRRRGQQKRARTGCERCRARRRKCNEEKPRCRRCVEADVECHYLTRISFLERNARTLIHGAVPAIELERTVYPTLQFVVDGESSERPERCVSRSSSPSQHVHQPQDRRAMAIGAGGEKTVVTDDLENLIQEQLLQDVDLNDLRMEAGHVMAQQPQDLIPRRLEHVPSVIHGNLTQTSSLLDPTPLKGVVSLRNLLEHNPQMSATALQGSTNSDTTTAVKPPIKQIALTDNKIHLLKHYAHRVAPWLDIYDLGQTFGLFVPRLATISPLVLDAVLKLSAVSSSSSVEEAETCSNGSSDLQAMSLRPGQVPEFVLLQTLVRVVLLKTRVFVGSVPDTWEPIFASGGPVPSFPNFNFKDSSYRRIWFGVVVLMSRLEIAYSLMHEIAPAVGSEILRERLPSSEEIEGEVYGFQKSLNSSLSCLALLSDAMSLCLRPSDEDHALSLPQPEPHESRANRWKHLFNELGSWHRDRPSELQELAELEGTGTSFPTILFTSRVGVSANVTYHVAMFLLMRHRPRTVLPQVEPNEMETIGKHMSPLWHARRACGIAMSSDPEHTQCWDPCMIAAFTLMARGMTHPAQQMELLLCLHRVMSSGWRVDNLIRSLRDEWGLLDQR